MAALRISRIPAKRASLQCESRLLSGVRDDNAKDIKAARWRRISRKPAQITPRDGNNVAAFVHGHGGRWRSKAVVAAGLDLDKAERAVIPADEIDFAAIVGHAEVGGDKLVAQALQVEVGFGFAALAESQMSVADASVGRASVGRG